MLNNQNVLIVHNELNLLHKSSKRHPQCPERVIEIVSHLKSVKNQNVAFCDSKQQLQTYKISDNSAKELVIKVHGESYFDFVEGMWHEGIKKSEMFINIDTYFMKDTFTAALQAVKSVLLGTAKLIKEGFPYVFSIVRPPGHHCGMKSQPHGFSFMNNLAIAVNYAMDNFETKKIAIVDWDAHHGEGTQHLFYDRNDVLFISMHRFDEGKFFPHIKESGSQNIGKGKGQGFNINVCWNLPAKKKDQKYQQNQTAGDLQYSACFEKIVMPILQKFDPDLIFVSCGFDSADGDPIGALKITKYGYMHMTSQLMKMKKKMHFILEGGYNIEVLKWASQAVIKALTGSTNEQQKQSIKQLQNNEKISPIGQSGIREALQAIGKYWKIQEI